MKCIIKEFGWCATHFTYYRWLCYLKITQPELWKAGSND